MGLALPQIRGDCVVNKCLNVLKVAHTLCVESFDLWPPDRPLNHLSRLGISLAVHA